MSDPTSEGGLIVFLRFPQLGKVKSRLAVTVGEEQAFHIYSKLVTHTLHTVSHLGIPLYLYYDGGLPHSSERLASAHYALQSEGDLGQRMQHALADVLQTHPKAVLIGSDCPGITTSILEDAFLLLDTFDIVIGPAWDGGYYLLGCKKINPGLFVGINWSSGTVLDETLEKCVSSQMSYAYLPMLRDVDTEEDWILIKKEMEEK